MRFTVLQVCVFWLVILTALVGVVSQAAIDKLPDSLLPCLWVPGPLLLSLIALLIVLRILQTPKERPGAAPPEPAVPEPEPPERPKEKPKPVKPAPPVPYFASPYPLLENWTGRQSELNSLDAWLKDEATPLCCLNGTEGMGKSSLAWTWLRRRVLPEQQKFTLKGIFQWSFREGLLSFEKFLEELGSYLEISSTSDPVSALGACLFQSRFLLVLDGFERLLSAYAVPAAELVPERFPEELQPGERRCVEWRTARFLRGLVAKAATKTLLISSLIPEDLEGCPGWQSMELGGLAPEDAVAYLRSRGIKGNDDELGNAAAVYDSHPLSLAKLAEVVHYDLQQPGEVSRAPSYEESVESTVRHQQVLERAYGTLPPGLAEFLSTLAALRSKAATGVIRFLAADLPDTELSSYRRRLEQEDWVLWNRDERTLEFHPMIRRCAYAALHDKSGTHKRLAGYLLPRAQKLDTDKVSTVAQLTPLIDFCHHIAHAGRFNEMQKLVRKKLIPDPLFYRFGAYQSCIELLRLLFPDSEYRPPRLQDPRAQAWTLNSLAVCYSLSGQPRRSLRASKLAVELAHSSGNKKELAICLGNLAAEQLKLGELEVAQYNLRQRLDLLGEAGDELHQAIGHQQLGCLLAYLGEFGEAKKELKEAQRVFDSGQDEHTEHACLVRGDLAWLSLLTGQAQAAQEFAGEALAMALSKEGSPGTTERNLIYAEWLVGAAKGSLAGKESERRDELLSEADTYLRAALTRCRRANLVEFEPDILLSRARWHLSHDRSQQEVQQDSGHHAEQARRCAEEALAIASRCEYRLKQTEIYIFLARLALVADEKYAAREHAKFAFDCALCDQPPHCYKPALDEAERLLKELEESSDTDRH